MTPDSLGQAAGIVAASLVFSTFYMRTMLPLRCVAIASNVAFLAYGLSFGLMPIWTLHAVLLPLNVLRLIEIRGLIAKLHAARNSDIDPLPLLQHLRHRRFKAGEIVFSKGDHADCAYVVAEGTVLIPEVGARIGRGGVFGEFGVLSPQHARTASAVAETDCDLYRLAERDIVAALYQNPSFALGLMRIVVQRQTANVRALEEKLALAKSLVDSSRH